MKSLKLFLISSIISFVMLDLGVFFLVESGRLNINKPTYSLRSVTSRFWVDINEDFGVWHEPHSSYNHKKSCFEVEYEANSHGARDVERLKSSDKDRVVVLGDSFVEGVGVSLEKRLTNLLEEQSKIEHLNFGTAGHFGTTQYFLMYKKLAKEFGHSSILLGILPNNDFYDDDYSYGKKVYFDRYRPYFVGQYPEYDLIYFKENLSGWGLRFFGYIKGLFREFTYTYNAIAFLSTANRFEDGGEGAETYSGYYDYKKDQLDVMFYSIEKLIEEAAGKKITVFTIPVIGDLLRFDKAKSSPLSKELKEFSRSKGFNYLDLLPLMHSHTRQWDKYYLPCDGHWSEYGNAVAFKYIKDHL